MNVRWITIPSLLTVLLWGTLCVSAPALAGDDHDAHGPYKEGAADEAVVLEGSATEYKPVMTVALGDTLLVPSLLLEGHFRTVSGFPVDREQTPFKAMSSFDATVRAGLMYTTVQALYPIILKAELEADLFLSKGQPAPIGGDGLPGTEDNEILLRKASLAISYKGLVALTGGFNTSHWGLGLLANDGAQHQEPGAASFSTPHHGDVVLRSALALGPFHDANNFKFALAYDILYEDDAMLHGDSGFQVVAAASIEPTTNSSVGMYGVRRHQVATPDKRGVEKATDVWVVDLTGHLEVGVGDAWKLKLEGEIALVVGETDLSPTVDFPVHDVLQLGAAARLSVNTADWGLVMDFAFASGDRNFDDSTQSAFKADRNFQMGFIFYESVMTALTARAPHTASDPDLIGYPAEDLDRFPTRGAISNSIAIFPRLWWRPAHGFEMFVGSLLAFSNVEMADPLNSRLAGGEPKNAFGTSPGAFQGAELDFGLRYTALIFGTELNLGLDAGVFLPGDALDSVSDGMGPVYAGRVSFHYHL